MAFCAIRYNVNRKQIIVSLSEKLKSPSVFDNLISKSRLNHIPQKSLKRIEK